MNELATYTRDVPDFPKPGILFRDITPLLAEPAAFQKAVDSFADRYRSHGIEQVVAIESRGFLFGSPLAYLLGAPLLIVRKPGKLPGACVRQSFTLEYGSDTLEMHQGMARPGLKTLVIDDLLATGGSAFATGQLLEQQGVTVHEYAFVIELDALAGRARLGEDRVHSLIRFG